MSLRGVIIILAVSIISVASLCAKPEIEKALNNYTISGKILMINECTNNQNDLPDKLLVEVDLVCTDGTKYNRIDRTIVTIPVAGANNQKDAKYEFDVKTNLIGDKWKIKRVRRDSNVQICNLISCPGTQNCRDTASNTYTVAATDGDADPTTVTHDLRFHCKCQ